MPEGAHALGLRNKHVMILSLTSTLSRLITGVLADYLCPPLVAVPASRDSTGEGGAVDDIDQEGRPKMVFVRQRPIRLYRSMFAALCSVILAGVYAWSAGWLDSEKGLWVLSGGVGTFYGALFTLTVSALSRRCRHCKRSTLMHSPSSLARDRVSSLWPDQLWPRVGHGLILRRPWLGPLLCESSRRPPRPKSDAQYLYALISVAVAEESVRPNGTGPATTTEAPSICYGPRCFRPSLWVATACALVSAAGFVFVARRWKA